MRPTMWAQKLNKLHDSKKFKKENRDQKWKNYESKLEVKETS